MLLNIVLGFFDDYKIQKNNMFFWAKIIYYHFDHYDQFDKSSLLEKKVFTKFHSFKNRPDSKLLNGSVRVSCSPGNDYNSLKNIAVYLLIKSYINYMKCIVTTVNPHVAYFIWSSAGTSPSASRWKGCRQKSQTVGQAFYMLVEVHCQDMPDKTQKMYQPILT